MNLSSTQPRLIQRCGLNREQKKLQYEYMGSTEFECGDQGQSLRRIFEKVLKTEIVTVSLSKNKVDFYLIATEDFDFKGYATVLQGLVNNAWRLQESSYLRESIEKHLGLVETKEYSFIETEVWFDFQNDVLFALTKDHADFLPIVLADIKETWRKRDEWLDSSEVKQFNKEVDKIRKRLSKVMDFFYIGKPEKTPTRIKVWLNTGRGNGSGWYTLNQLRNFTSRREAKAK